MMFEFDTEGPDPAKGHNPPRLGFELKSFPVYYVLGVPHCPICRVEMSLDNAFPGQYSCTEWKRGGKRCAYTYGAWWPLSQERETV